MRPFCPFPFVAKRRLAARTRENLGNSQDNDIRYGETDHEGDEILASISVSTAILSIFMKTNM